MPRRRAPTSTPPRLRVADRVGDQVAQDALEQHRVAETRYAVVGTIAQAQAALERLGLEVHAQALEQRREREVRWGSP